MGNINTKGKKSGGKNVGSIFAPPPPIPCKSCKPCCPPKNNNTVLIVVIIIILIIIIFIAPLIVKHKTLGWYNDYNTYNTKKTFSTLLYIYYFQSNLLYKLCNLFQPEAYQLNQASWYYISHLIETCGSDKASGWVIPYHLTTSLVPFNIPNDDGTTDLNSPCRWTWNWALYGADAKGIPTKNINNMTDKGITYKSLKQSITTDDGKDGSQTITKISKSGGLPSAVNFATNVIAGNTNFDNNGNLILISDWKVLIQAWGSFWAKNDDNLYMLGIDKIYTGPGTYPTPYGITTITKDNTISVTPNSNPQMTKEVCMKMWMAQPPYDKPFYQSNFLYQVWGMPPDSPLIEAFITGASISGSGQKLYPDLLARLLGVTDGMISNGWVGFLNELNPKSEAQIKSVVYGEDVNIQGTNKLLKDTTSGDKDNHKNCSTADKWKIGTSSIGAAAGVLTMFAFLSNPGGWVIAGVLGAATIAGTAAGIGTAANAKCGAFGPPGNNG